MGRDEKELLIEGKNFGGKFGRRRGSFHSIRRADMKSMGKNEKGSLLIFSC